MHHLAGWGIHACCSWVDMWDEVGGWGVNIYLIINLLYILMQFLTILKTNSWEEAIFDQFKLNIHVITLSVNKLLCKLRQIMTRYDFQGLDESFCR